MTRAPPLSAGFIIMLVLFCNSFRALVSSGLMLFFLLGSGNLSVMMLVFAWVNVSRKGFRFFLGVQEFFALNGFCWVWDESFSLVEDVSWDSEKKSINLSLLWKAVTSVKMSYRSGWFGVGQKDKPLPRII